MVNKQAGKAGPTCVVFFVSDSFEIFEKSGVAALPPQGSNSIGGANNTPPPFKEFAEIMLLLVPLHDLCMANGGLGAGRNALKACHRRLYDTTEEPNSTSFLASQKSSKRQLCTSMSPSASSRSPKSL